MNILSQLTLAPVLVGALGAHDVHAKAVEDLKLDDVREQAAICAQDLSEARGNTRSSVSVSGGLLFACNYPLPSDDLEVDEVDHDKALCLKSSLGGLVRETGPKATERFLGLCQDALTREMDIHHKRTPSTWTSPELIEGIESCMDDKLYGRQDGEVKSATYINDGVEIYTGYAESAMFDTFPNIFSMNHYTGRGHYIVSQGEDKVAIYPHGDGERSVMVDSVVEVRDPNDGVKGTRYALHKDRVIAVSAGGNGTDSAYDLTGQGIMVLPFTLAPLGIDRDGLLKGGDLGALGGDTDEKVRKILLQVYQAQCMNDK